MYTNHFHFSLTTHDLPLIFISVLADLRNKIKKEREDFDRASKMTVPEKQKLEARRALVDGLNLTGEEQTSKGLSNAEINRIDEHYKWFLNVILRASKAGDCIDSEDIPQPMDLNRLFQAWWSKAERDDKSLLFVDLTEDNQHGLLRKAKWNFQGKELVYPSDM